MSLKKLTVIGGEIEYSARRVKLFFLHTCTNCTSTKLDETKEEA